MQYPHSTQTLHKLYSCLLGGFKLLESQSAAWLHLQIEYKSFLYNFPHLLLEPCR